jgi:glycosyltransferase involved in cell wall biosynthesis
MKTIFLVNPISGRGHLDAYARLYSRAFIELGYRVVLIAETDAGTSAHLARNSVAQRDAFSFISFAEASKGAVRKSSARKAQLVWQQEGPAGILRRLVDLPRRGARALLPEFILSSWLALRREAFSKLSHIRAVGTLRKCFFPDAGRVSLKTMGQHIQNVSTSRAISPDLIFFLYLDLMAEGRSSVAALDAVDPVPWAGILFHPKLVRSPQSKIEGYFTSHNARGGIFLVPSAIEVYAKAAPQLKFFQAPDVADLELALEPPPMANQIRRLAAGRTIILQIGTITPHKGIVTLLDVIAKADPRRFFFALVGEVYWQHFGRDEQRLRDFYVQTPENVLVQEGYVSEESEYNSLITACDIIYAVYDGFDSSSNSLTKAAGLRRPIVAAKGTLMGERIVSSEIGTVVTSGDVDDILVALECMASRSIDSFGFDRYLDQHSLEELKAVLAKGLSLWLAAPAPSTID